MKTDELPFKLNIGVDTYSPDITDQALKFLRLKNVQPRRDRWIPPTGYTLKETISPGNDTIHAFALYTEPFLAYSDLYALGDTEIWRYNFSTNLFDGAAIYTTMPTGKLPYAIVPWYDRVYVSKRGLPLLKLQGTVVTPVDGAPAGRYGIVSNNHLMLANISNTASDLPTRIQWSDLYLPESWGFSEASEADFFDLEVTDEEVTGISYQRGQTVIYTRNSIWVAKYYPLPTGFRFDPLYTGIGNLYHGAQVRVKELDFFIGEDNFYMLDGLQLRAFGDEIWQYFQDTKGAITAQTEIKSFYDSAKGEVHWVYPHSTDTRWSIVYNYKENKWSDRDPQDIYTELSLKFAARGFTVIDDVSALIDTMNDPVTELIDGDWQFFDGNFTQIAAGTNGRVYIPANIFIKQSGLGFDCEAESYEFYWEKLFETTEVNAFTVFYTSAGSPVLELLVGTRKHRNEAITWSAPADINDMLPGETTFHIRAQGVGRLMRFKLRWTTTVDDYITELTNCSFHKLDNSPDDP